MTNGKIIVLEGIDKSGKTTQSKLLVDYVSSMTSLKAVQMNFPNYSTFSGNPQTPKRPDTIQSTCVTRFIYTK